MSSDFADPPVLDDAAGVHVAEPRTLLIGYLDWYRDALLRKIDGLSDEALRTPMDPPGWSPLGLVQHLGWVERRWLRWGFRAEQIDGYPPGEDGAEWQVDPGVPAAEVLAAYGAEVALARAIIDGADLSAPSSLGGRFPTREVAPPLVRILFHLLQEYARHVGHIDVVRELIDGTVGE